MRAYLFGFVGLLFVVGCSTAQVTPDIETFGKAVTKIVKDDRATSAAKSLPDRVAEARRQDFVRAKVVYASEDRGECSYSRPAIAVQGKPFDEALGKLPHRITLLNPTDDLTECTRRADKIMRNGEIIECPQWGYGFMDAFPEDTADLVLGKLDASNAV